MIDDQTVLALSPVASFQALGENEGAVVLMTDSGQLYTCNDTAVALLKAVDGARPLGSIAELMLAEFEVSREILQADLVKVAGELKAERIVEVVEGPA
jgi:hypothetical protein